MRLNFRREDSPVLALRQFIPLRVPLKRETSSNSRSPCPAPSGTTAGTTQQFKLLCGSDLPSYGLARLPATSLLQCIDICSSWHPRCAAVSYEASAAHGANNCYLKSAVVSPGKTQPYEIDSATAIWPSTQEDCPANETVVAKGYIFETFCGLDYPRDSMVQSFAGSLQECMGLCAGQRRCSGVSYEASMAHGYGNCYLKRSAETSGLLKQDYVVDSAFRSSLASPSVATSSSTTPTTSLSSSSTTTPVGAVSSNSATPPSGNSTQYPSMSWIAGAVIGPIALIALVGGLVFLLLYRWKRPETTTTQLGKAELSADIPGLFQTQDGGLAKPVPELDSQHLFEVSTKGK